MILVDFSSILHRKIYTSLNSIKPKKQNDHFITSEYIGLTKYYILQELFDIQLEFKSKFGEMIICLDRAETGYWRKDFFPSYKSNRKSSREKSDINFTEVFAEIEPFIDQIRKNLPWKVVEVPKAEADDSMLVLAKEYNQFENILIHSPDKDMIQAQRNNETVFQYSSLTKKWLVPENKHDSMDHWIREHVMLGDDSDGVPKVVDHTEFSETFINYLIKEGCLDLNPFDFKNSTSLDVIKKHKLITEFDVYKLNRKKECTGIKDIYKDLRFGPSALEEIFNGQHGLKLRKEELKKEKETASKERKKEINQEIKSLEIDNLTRSERFENFLDSHPLYRKHYERNFTLVMEEGIPSDIWNNIILSYKTACQDYNQKEFEEYLNANSLQSIIMDLPRVFKINRELTADDFSW